MIRQPVTVPEHSSSRAWRRGDDRLRLCIPGVQNPVPDGMQSHTTVAGPDKLHEWRHIEIPFVTPPDETLYPNDY
ncbi:MAG: hypothetical protein R6V19_06475 [Armatimonadota bacterium]